jgi:hypothetical protein
MSRPSVWSRATSRPATTGRPSRGPRRWAPCDRRRMPAAGEVRRSQRAGQASSTATSLTQSPGRHRVRPEAAGPAAGSVRPLRPAVVAATVNVSTGRRGCGGRRGGSDLGGWHVPCGEGGLSMTARGRARLRGGMFGALAVLLVVVEPEATLAGGRGGGGRGGGSGHGVSGGAGGPAAQGRPVGGGGPAMQGRSGGGSHGHQGSHGHGGFHGHHGGRGSAFIAVGPSFGWSPWWSGPGWGWDPWRPWYGAGVWPGYAASSPPVYIQQPQAYWYYCPPARAYYPYVQSCPEAWVPVLPRAE